MIEDKPHTLDPKEISQLIKEGVELDNSGNHMYIMRFGWNNEWNQAADPAPFKIKPHLNEKLRKDALGMPYVVPPYGMQKHLRKKKDAKEPMTIQEQLEAILNVQSNYAIGEIQGSLQYPSGNVWMIIDVWPEFQAGVERGYYPELCSPTFNFIKNTPDGVEDAQFLNLQAVPNSGYDPEYTQIQPICKNGIKECMAEMVAYGASGGLLKARKEGKSFSNRIIGASGVMSEEQGSEKTAESRISDLESGMAEISKRVSSMEPKLDAIAEKILKENPAADPPADAAISGAAGKTQLELLKKELDQLKENDATNTKLVKQFEKEKQETEKKLRLAQATSIVERVHKNDKLDEKAKIAKINEYVEMKDAAGNPRDLELLDNTLKSVIPEPTESSGISGAYGLFRPESTTETTNRPKNSEIMEAIRS